MIRQTIKKYLRYARILRAKVRRMTAKTRLTRALPEIKYGIMKDFAHRGNFGVFVETGTYEGEMINAVKNNFRKIYSVELGKELADKAVRRFSKDPHVKIIHGDSAIELPKLCLQLRTPCLFWFDAHYSGNDALGSEITPIITELNAVLKRPFRDAILIDDLRLFNGVDYPTVGKIKRIVAKIHPDYAFETGDDMIKIYPHDYN